MIEVGTWGRVGGNRDRQMRSWGCAAKPDLGTMLNTLGKHSGKSLPTAFQDWSNTKVDAAKQCRANCRKTGLSRFRPLFTTHGENSCKSAAKLSAENATANY